jgi:hypothetical protein
MANMLPEEQMNELGRTAGTAAELTFVPGLARAGDAVGDAMIDPSIANVSRAGAASGAALMRPGIVLGSLGAGYAGAAAKDLGLLDPSQAQAQGLTPRQRRMLEIEETRKKQDSSIRKDEAEADAQRTLKTEAARKDREQYDSQVANAEGKLQDALAKAKRGRFEDSDTKKFYDTTAGYTPAILPAITGAVSRLVGGNNPIAKYAFPIGVGIPEGVVGANGPLGYDAYIGPPAYNPTREAYEEYSRDLPPTDPAGKPTRRAEWQAYARGLPEENPIRSAASKEFYDPTKLTERSLYGGVEGAVGGYGGSLVASLLAKGANALASPFRGGGRQGPQLGGPGGPSSGGLPPGGGNQGISGTPPATLVPEGTALGVARNGLAGGPAQRQLPSPVASPSQSALEPRVFTKSKGKDGVTRYHEGDTGHFAGNPRKKE